MTAHFVPTAVLRAARENAGFTQSSLAPRLSVTPSVVSRMEKDELTDRAVAWRYLDAVASSDSDAIKEFYDRPWMASERPSFLHPDKDILWLIERHMQALDAFESKADFDTILAKPVQALRSRLVDTAHYLLRTDHTVAWVGQIGLGKTTALSHATGLTQASERGRESIFPTGSGRTTLCEVMIKTAPAFGLSVECVPPDEVRALVADLVLGLAKREAGVTTEVDRVLRAMAGIHRETVVENGKKRLVDPIRRMLDNGDTPEEIVNRLVAAMNLEARVGNTMILSENKAQGLDWLSTNVAKINSGQHPDFGMASRITVLLPSKVLRKSPYDISVLDTKGIEGTTQRPDLRLLIDEKSTLTVLCSRFNDAPGEKAIALLKEIQDTRSDAVERGRICVVVLPWLDEAMGVKGDDGATPSSVEEGYLIREDQAREALAREGLTDVPIYFYNALTEDADEIWDRLNGQLRAMRERQHARAEQLAATATTLIEDSHAAASLEARKEIAAVIDRFVARNGSLPVLVRPAHQNLIEQLRIGAASSIAASMSRRGGWPNFSLHHLLGVGVRADAAARSARSFIGLAEAIDDQATRFSHLPDVVQFLASLQEDVKAWEQEYLVQALALGRTAFRPQLDAANDLWAKCIGRWGHGSGYRDDIAQEVQNWFDNEPTLNDGRKSVESGLTQLWRELVLGALTQATRFDEFAEDPE